MSVTKVAATLGVSVSTVKWHLSHADVQHAEERAARHESPAANLEEGPPQTRPPLRAGFAENLRVLRGLHGLTNAALSRLLGISQQTLSEWQTGKQHPQWPALKRLSDFFGVPVQLLADGAVAELGRFYFTSDAFLHTERRVREISESWPGGTHAG